MQRPRSGDDLIDPWEKSQTWSACDTVTQPVGGLSSLSKSLRQSVWRQADGCWPILKFQCLDLAHTHTHTRAHSYLQLWILKTHFHAADQGSLAFVLHMREKIFKAPCVLLSLFTSLNLCCGKFGTPITDDVSKLSLLKQNIPSDYEIPLHYIPREVAGACWVVLNVYPLEQSLRNLANMFGAVSSNKENILVFIAMLKSLRFTFDHQELETAMQVFQCHYQEGRFKNELYFDYIEELLHVAGHEASSFSCKPPPCRNSANAPGGQKEGRDYRWWKRTPLLLVFIPVTACVILIIWRIASTRHLPARPAEEIEMAPRGIVPSVSVVSIPLQKLAHDTADALPEEDVVAGHEMR
ncbi:uncharacterized protein [Syngnathus scovelli]|uniref:uncharacterized protein n=1 Tax=Syngnathus scovelli TaxID=161590 RepID=UPI00210FB6DB|nr:uncharacterized protein LOC125992345 [Syngnathus scovelli]